MFPNGDVNKKHKLTRVSILLDFDDGISLAANKEEKQRSFVVGNDEIHVPRRIET